MDSFFVNLHKFQFNIHYTDKVAKFTPHGKRVSRNCKTFDLIDSDIKHSEFEMLGISVGDLIKAYYYNSKYQDQTQVEDQNEDNGGRKEERVLLSNYKRGRVVDELNSKDRKRINELKKSMITSVLKTDYYDDSCNFLGYLRDGQVFQLATHNEYKSSTIESFFRSKLLFSNHNSLHDVVRKYPYMTEDRNNAKRNTDYYNWFFPNINDRFIDTLVMFFYMGKSLYVSVHEQTVFDEPVSMKDWIDMIDPKWVIPGYGDKTKMISDIFGKCNEREQQVLEAQKEMIIDNWDQFDDLLPVYAFRKLYFIRFSYGMVNELTNRIRHAKFMHIVPKKWRGDKKLYAIRNQWIYELGGNCGKDWWGPDVKFEKNSEHYQIGKEGVDDYFYDLLELSDHGDDEDNQMEFAYDLPMRLNPELTDKDDVDLMEGELYKFMTDGEAMARAIDLDGDHSKSLNEKLRELNKIGYSRTGEDSNQVYLLVPPGHQIRQNYSSMMKCDDFFVPSVDRRLPRIVLMSLIDEDEI
jgi:hypothetical protein